MEKWKQKNKKTKLKKTPNQRNTETGLCGTWFCLGQKSRFCLLFIKLGSFLDIWPCNACNHSFAGLLVQELEYISLCIDKNIYNPTLCHVIWNTHHVKKLVKRYVKKLHVFFFFILATENDLHPLSYVIGCILLYSSSFLGRHTRGHYLS